VKGRGASTDALSVSKDSYATFRSFEEPARRGGEEGGVSMLSSPGRANMGLLGVSGVKGELEVLMVIEGLRLVVMLSISGAAWRTESLFFISLLAVWSSLVYCCLSRSSLTLVIAGFLAAQLFDVALVGVHELLCKIVAVCSVTADFIKLVEK